MTNITFRRIDLEFYNLPGTSVLNIITILKRVELHGITIEDSNLGSYAGIEANGDINELDMVNITLSNIRIKS